MLNCYVIVVIYLFQGEKAYSRDYTIKGRVKVKILDDQGQALKPEAKNSTVVFLFVTHTQKRT